jgi:hypothetical protein
MGCPSNLDVGYGTPNRGEDRVCRVFETQPLLLQTFFRSFTGCRFAKGGTMEGRYSEELRDELTRLLRKQTEVLESRTFGSASDTDILEYEIRQEVIHEICNQLANSAAA